MSVPERDNAGQDTGISRHLSHTMTQPLTDMTERQLHKLIAQFADLLIASNKQVHSLNAINAQYAREYAQLAQRHNALIEGAVQLSADFNQLEQENVSLRAACGMPPSPHVGQSLFFLQHPNNVRRAQVARNKQPRQSCVESLREPGGGLGLRAPAAARSGEGVAREGRFGAVGDGRALSTSAKEGTEEGEGPDASSGPGPTVVDDE
jgi:hypothetical protein